MFSASEALAFLESLMRDIWQNLNADKLSNFYQNGVIGHHHDEILDIEALKERMTSLQQNSKKRKFSISKIIAIDNFIFFELRQTILSHDNTLLEKNTLNVYLIEQEKVKEFWIVPDKSCPGYKQLSENMPHIQNHFRHDIQNKELFLQRLADFDYFHPEKNIRLTNAEKEKLYYYLNGYSAKETANKLNLSFRTVEDQLATIKQKFSCSTRHELRQSIFPQEKK